MQRLFLTVNMKAKIDGEEIEMNIDNIKEHFEKTKDYVKELEGEDEESI